jgi:hypothetical protein
MQGQNLFLRASEPGIVVIKKAQKQKGWSRKDETPLIVASNFLESDKTYPVEGFYGKIYAHGVNEVSWKRFLEGRQAIRAKVFIAYCNTLEIAWQQVVDWDCFDGQLPLFIF